MRPARARNIVVTVVGVIAILLGLLWVGQGLNLLKGSAMSGDSTWFIVGAVLVLAGVLLIALGRRRADPRADPRA